MISPLTGAACVHVIKFVFICNVGVRNLAVFLLHLKQLFSNNVFVTFSSVYVLHKLQPCEMNSAAVQEIISQVSSSSSETKKCLKD